MDQAGAVVLAGFFVVGQVYKITSAGSTSFTSIGAESNSPDVIFRATGAGSGSGAAAIMSTVDASVADIVALASVGGGGLAAYVHNQATPTTVWTINHNLGRYPSVELLSSGMQEIDGEVAHPSVNQTVVTLNPATAGLARLI
jgi:hypothetical protein